ncbi:uncharacterized protein LOC117301624 isoform X2 [Asterias rubens]|uniref:uncharacterized protein LOC117301624 isoform X2 n=1 Tax=Asterias rubens TaxID=7604 RepID=UPI001454F978|nr:uncharacterized protein LOC117301624 isoform X2 [Asterias rubens]
MPGDEIARCGSGVASFKNKTVIFNQDNGNLTILDIGLADEAVFECFVYGQYISHTNTTRVDVKKANFGVQAENILTSGEGEDVSLPCSVVDSGTTDQRSFTFEWSLNGTILQSCNPSDEVIYSVDQTGKYALHHGKTSCNLTILNLNLKDEGRHQCDVHDSFYNQSNYNSTTIVVASTITSTEIVLASEPLSMTATNYMRDVGTTKFKTTQITAEPSLTTTLPAETNFNGAVKPKIVTLKTGQGSGDTPLESARKDAVLITAVSSGLFLVAISLLVVASRLRKDRHSAVQINQTNDANRATVTFRRAPSPGSIRIGPNLSSRFEQQETAYAEVREIGDHATSTTDNRNVIAHTYAESRLNLSEEDEAPSPPPPPRGILYPPPHWLWQ